MNQNLKKGLRLGALGFCTGLMIGLVIYFVSPGDPASRRFDVVKFLLSGLPGAMAMGFVEVYDIDSWSITRSTLVHFVITFATFFLVALWQKWFSFGTPVFWITTGAMITGYFIIWLIMYLKWNREVRKMNQELARWKSSCPPDPPEEAS